MKPPVCIFTYAGGALSLPWTVRGVRAAGLVPVICEQHDQPLPRQLRASLERDGVELVTTTFPRRGNLNGTDCAAGICRELALAAARHGASHAIKLDDDALIVRPGLFLEHRDVDSVGLVWPGGNRSGAYGMAYMLRRSMAEEIAALLEWESLDPSAPEDLTVWAAAASLGTQISHRFRPARGPFSAIPADADPREAVERFDVVTVGNMPRGGWGNRPVEQAHQLRGLVLAAEALHGSCKAPAGAVQGVASQAPR